jgi:cysteine desulfuration protein SufE
MERYEYIIQLGKSLPLIKDEFKTDSNVIKAASQSMVAKKTMKIVFTADSDAILTKELSQF